VKVGVRLVLELPGHKPSIRLRQLSRFTHHAGSAFRCRCQDDFGAEESHEAPALDAERLCHRDHQWVPFLRAYHRESDAGVAARRFDDRLARLEPAGTLGVLDDAQREPVLDRAEWIEGFDLHVEVDALRREPADSHDGSVADRFEDAGEFCHVGGWIVGRNLWHEAEHELSALPARSGRWSIYRWRFGSPGRHCSFSSRG
jgi:hypothetical protein